MSAGRLNKKSLGIVMLLSVGLLLAGCSGSKSSDTGTYSGSVYTVKRGDTLYRISRTTGTSVKELARLNGISPPYTIEVGQKLKLGGRKVAVLHVNQPPNQRPKPHRLHRHQRYRNHPGRQ